MSQSLRSGVLAPASRLETARKPSDPCDHTEQAVSRLLPICGRDEKFDAGGRERGQSKRATIHTSQAPQPPTLLSPPPRKLWETHTDGTVQY